MMKLIINIKTLSRFKLNNIETHYLVYHHNEPWDPNAGIISATIFIILDYQTPNFPIKLLNFPTASHNQ